MKPADGVDSLTFVPVLYSGTAQAQEALARWSGREAGSDEPLWLYGRKVLCWTAAVWN
ncbi:MAG: hypothetical protein ACLRI7_09300 [Ruthenibacterium lactatiformans]